MLTQPTKILIQLLHTLLMSFDTFALKPLMQLSQKVSFPVQQSRSRKSASPTKRQKRTTEHTRLRLTSSALFSASVFPGASLSFSLSSSDLTPSSVSFSGRFVSGVDSGLGVVASPSFFFPLFFFFFSIRPPLTLLPFSLSLPPPTEYSSPAMLAVLG